MTCASMESQRLEDPILCTRPLSVTINEQFVVRSLGRHAFLVI